MSDSERSQNAPKKFPTTVTIAVPAEITRQDIREWTDVYDADCDIKHSGGTTPDGLVEWSITPTWGVEYAEIVDHFGPNARIEGVAPYEMEE